MGGVTDGFTELCALYSAGTVVLVLRHSKIHDRVDFCCTATEFFYVGVQSCSMPQCEHCGDDIAYPHTCNYCDRTHCSEHRLPENHECVGLYPRAEKRFESDAPDTATVTRDSSEVDAHNNEPESAANVGTVGSTPTPDYKKSPAVETTSEDDGTGIITRSKSVLSSLFGALFAPLILTRKTVRGAWKRKYRLLIVALLVLGSGSLAIAGPVDLGNYLGDQGEQVDGAITNATTQLLQRVDNVTNESEAVPTEEATSENDQLDSSDASTRNSEPIGAETGTEDDQLNVTLLEREIHRDVNDHRRKHDLGLLTFDTELAAIARTHSKDMVQRNFYDHTNPDGQDATTRYLEAGYNCRIEVGDTIWRSGENINAVYWDELSENYSYVTNESRMAEIVVRQWMQSKGHRENILKPFWRVEGIGVSSEPYEGGKELYVTQNFC